MISKRMFSNHFQQKASCLNLRWGARNSALIWPPLIPENQASLFWLLNVMEQLIIPATLQETATDFASNNSRTSGGPSTASGRPIGSCESTRKLNARSRLLIRLSLQAMPQG